jgi:topoisomerase-4 subunit A
MYKMDDGNYTKVANIVGQAMQYHPHGDQSILGALVQLGQKGYLIDCQGNWGNILTGDSNAAPRYIEARLSKFAKDVVFDEKITNWLTSYDGRNQEPEELPVRFPLLLAQGTEGIAVGMASKILPHNFNELIDASIAILHGEDFTIYPDFPTGGMADCSNYRDGQRGGTVKVRARIGKVDKSTLVITEIPYGKTSGMVKDSIDKAAQKGKIKIKKIDDFTTDKVNITIHLPKDVSPDKTIDALYAFTDCESNIAPNACVIMDSKPQFISVKDILIYDTNHTRDLLRRQLEIRLGELGDDWFYSSLEKIFFEEKVYKILEEDQKTWEKQLKDILEKMKTYEPAVGRKITIEDIQKLVEKPVRKISKFDVKAVDAKISSIEAEMKKVKYNIGHITEYTVNWFKGLKEKYGKNFPRQTEITSFETIAATKVVSNNAKLYANMAEGFVGTGLKKDDGGQYICDCSDLSEIIVARKDGMYMVSKVSDKAFFGKDLIYVGVFTRGDERTIYNVIYRNGKDKRYYAKRFNIKSITRDKEYDMVHGDAGSTVVWFTANHNGEAGTVRVYLRPRPKLKKTKLEYDFSNLDIKGKGSRGNLVCKYPVQKIVLKSKGVSTIGGKDIWFDKDVQRLNDEEHGIYLGSFEGEDKILAVFKDGTYYTTGFDLAYRYQGEMLKIEMLDEDKTYTALYFDGASKSFYVKRFSFTEADNTPTSFISDAKGSYLVDISDDLHPTVIVTFGGKNASKEPETIDAEEFIAKKGLTAKGKKCSSLNVASVAFGEPIHKPEDDIPDNDEEEEAEENEENVENEVENAPETKDEKPAANEEKIEEKPARKGKDIPALPNEVIDLGVDDVPPSVDDGGSSGHDDDDDSSEEEEPTLFDL